MGTADRLGLCSAPVAQAISENAVFDAVWSIVTRRIGERTSATVDLLSEVLHGLGQLHRRDHELLAGDRVLNDDRQVLPRIARATGLGLCLYLGNRRIAGVSVLDAGEAPDPGGYADAIVVETVLRKREMFRGEVERVGGPAVIACRPLFATEKPEDYGPIGMVEAFLDHNAYREVVATVLRETMGTDIKTTDEHHVDRMESVTHFIDDVARRLQLLALNGNIIAAQAGDHGRAFRVVCRELSSLADQSKDAVSEARKLSEELGWNRTPEEAIAPIDEPVEEPVEPEAEVAAPPPEG